MIQITTDLWLTTLQEAQTESIKVGKEFIIFPQITTVLLLTTLQDTQTESIQGIERIYYFDANYYGFIADEVTRHTKRKYTRYGKNLLFCHKLI